jgi:hypothetical protein
MIKNMGNKWIITGILWFGIVLLTFYNASKINQLQETLNEAETLKMDQQFWQRHSEEFDKLAAEGKRLYLTTDSPDMGLLTVDHHFKTICMQNGLPAVTVTRQQGNGSDNELPVGILFAGNSSEALKLLKSIKKEMPYFIAKNIKINVDPIARKVVLDASYILRYRTGPDGNEPKNSGGA